MAQKLFYKGLSLIWLFSMLIGLSGTVAASGTSLASQSSPASGFPALRSQVTASIPAFPLKVSSNKRYLVDQNNNPFFWSGDAAWSLIAQLNNTDAITYLDNRQQQGFSVVLVNLLEHKFADNAPADFYNDKPFTGKNFTTPNEAYFAHADYVINSAASRGIVVLLDALYVGYNCNDEGWCTEIGNASTADMTAWGTYVGNRYKNFGNIVWVVGGDTDPGWYNLTSKMNAFANALIAADPNHVITAHNAPSEMAVIPYDVPPVPSWLTLNDTYIQYSSNSTFSGAKSAYNYRNNSNPMPFFQIEGDYENEHGLSQQQLRSQAYWTALAGGIGHIFGNGPMWCFSSAGTCFVSGSWKNQLNSQGAASMNYYQKLFKSLDWFNLVPDFNHTVLTAGYGSGSSYVSAGLSPLGTMVAYLPNKNSVTVNMSKLPGDSTAYWYDPSNGQTTIAVTALPNSGTHVFTPSGNNAGGGTDWVLLLKAKINLNLPYSVFLPLTIR